LAALRKYRRAIRKLRQQREVLQAQYQKYFEQCRTVQATLSIKHDEYSILLEKYKALEETEHDTQLHTHHIALEKTQLQNQLYTLQAQLAEQTTLVQTKNTELQTMQLQHFKQMKALKNKKHCNMSEVQTILQERPKLLEQVRTLKEQVQQLQHQSRTSVLTNVMRPSLTTNEAPSHSTKTTTTYHHHPPPAKLLDTTTSIATAPSLSSSLTFKSTHKQRKQLLRTISEGIDNNIDKDNDKSTTSIRGKISSSTAPKRFPTSTVEQFLQQPLPLTSLIRRTRDLDDENDEIPVSLVSHKSKRVKVSNLVAFSVPAERKRIPPSIDASSSSYVTTTRTKNQNDPDSDDDDDEDHDASIKNRVPSLQSMRIPVVRRTDNNNDDDGTDILSFDQKSLGTRPIPIPFIRQQHPAPNKRSSSNSTARLVLPLPPPPKKKQTIISFTKRS
jgi:hypothetical protein